MALKGFLRRAGRGTAVLSVAVALGACSPTFRNHGYAPTEEELLEIIVGVDTRATVEDVIGQPSTAGVLTDGAYYYLADRRRQFAYQEPQVIERQLVAVRFDAEGVVSNIERFTLEDGRVVPLSRRVTDSAVQDTAFIRQLLGNVGNFDASGLLGGGGDGGGI